MRLERIVKILALFSLLWFFTGFSVSHAKKEEPKMPEPIKGPGVASLEKDLAEITLREGDLFFDKKNTKLFLEMTGNLSGDGDIGTLVGSNGQEESGWFVSIEYDKTGYVKDEEKDKLDPVKMLESMTENEKRANIERKAKGLPEMELAGWAIQPKYDEKSHNLVWAVKFKVKNTDGTEYESVNVNTRILGRRGVTSMVLVCDAKDLEKLSTTEYPQIIANYRYKKGERYEDYDPKKDKVSEYGLTALILGGGAAAVAAKKLGFLAVVGLVLKKGFVFIIAGIAALFGRLKSLIFRKKD